MISKEIIYALICSDDKKILIKPHVFLTIQEIFKTPSLIACELTAAKAHEGLVFWDWSVEAHSMSLLKIRYMTGKLSQTFKDGSFYIYCNETSEVMLSNLKFLNVPYICIIDENTNISFVGVDTLNTTTLDSDYFTNFYVTKAYGKVISMRNLGLDFKHIPDIVLPKDVLSSDGNTPRSELSIWRELNAKLSLEYAMDDDSTTNLLNSDSFAGI